nr:MAG TPA: hypothetical protein [Caudoviricetes sp.]
MHPFPTTGSVKISDMQHNTHNPHKCPDISTPIVLTKVTPMNQPYRRRTICDEHCQAKSYDVRYYLTKMGVEFVT